MKNLNRNVSLLCGCCGNDQFETLDIQYGDLRDAPDDTRLKCAYCGIITTKADLLADNEELINANIEDVKNEAVKEIAKDLKNALKGLGGTIKIG